MILYLKTVPESGDVGESYIWDDVRMSQNCISMLKYVEDNGERLRAKYLSWVFELGQSKFAERTMVEHLLLDSGYSFWWMTLLTEKSIYKSPLSDAIRLIALDEILTDKAVKNLDIVGHDLKLIRIIQFICKSKSIKCSAVSSIPRLSRVRFRCKDFCMKPRLLGKAILTLIKFASLTLQNNKQNVSKFNSNSNSIFFCSYFFTEQSDSKSFMRRYWGNLIDEMDQNGVKTSWLHLYVKGKGKIVRKDANEMLSDLNNSSDHLGSHSFIQDFTTLKVLKKVIKQWFYLVFKEAELASFDLEGESCAGQALWMLMKEDWANSLIGPASVGSLVWIETFEAAFRRLPKYSKGYYLCENQPWERALTMAWRKRGCGELTAVPHSSVRFWDLRYFYDSRTYQGVYDGNMPFPDFTAANSKDSEEFFINSGYPTAKIVRLEALRYSYLLEQQCTSVSSSEKLRVLVLGDYLESATLRVMGLLSDAYHSTRELVDISVKSHPNCPIESQRFPNLNMEIGGNDLHSLLSDCDIAFCSNLTSAALDAYAYGVKVIVALDEKGLNLSPLRGKESVTFVSTSEHLTFILKHLYNQPRYPNALQQRDFFYLSSNSDMWRRALEIRPF